MMVNADKESNESDLLEVLKSVVFFFFFQAEDGIRDIGVTGVQTCALPISGRTIPTARPRPAATRSARSGPGGRDRPARARCGHREPPARCLAARPRASTPDRKSVV